MDETDLYIFRNLLENSRITYRELADMCNLSVSSIHKRIRRLEDYGIIGAYIARPSLIALKSIFVLIFGTSKAKSMDVVSKEVGQHESVRYIGITGGKFIYISVFLRDISELQDLSTYVSEAAWISEPTIGIINIPYITIPESLTSIDYKILKSLNRDARKSITDIADDVGISAKTVRTRLDYMIENQLVTFRIQWYPHKESFVTVFHLTLNKGTDINSTIKYLHENFAQNIAYCYSYSNIPHLITMLSWAKNAEDSHKVQEELKDMDFKDVIPHIFLNGYYYDCWIDQLLRTK
jgi:DNA-binding Lrp family transcriptional regulator